jgi:SAM-dependent methyltransferase
VTGFTGQNYAQLLAYRNEGLRKFGAMLTDQIERPPARCFFPKVWAASRTTKFPSLRAGPVRIGAAGPSMIVADELLAHRKSVKILDIGCAAGSFRDYLELRDSARRIDYAGVDVTHFAVDFPVYPNLAAAPGNDYDLIFLSEVAEHMTADTFAQEYLQRLPRMLKRDGAAIVSVPNPLAPAVLHRDVTHVQHYPWYDLYALLRFYFEEIDVLRTHFVSSPRRLFGLPLRRAVAYTIEVDWCEGLVLTARRPAV